MNYNNSPYLNQFGMTVDTDADLLKVDARVLNPPVLKYGPGSKSIKVVRIFWPSVRETGP